MIGWGVLTTTTTTTTVTSSTSSTTKVLISLGLPLSLMKGLMLSILERDQL